MRHAIFAAAAVAAALAACGTSTPAAPTATETFTAQSPAPPTSALPTSAAPSAVETPAAWTMPNLVGAGLQDAQDSIQELTGFGIAITTSHDATGANRMQLSDRNWKVCTQNVPPGATITPESRIDFGTVKRDEGC